MARDKKRKSHPKPRFGWSSPSSPSWWQGPNGEIDHHYPGQLEYQRQHDWSKPGTFNQPPPPAGWRRVTCDFKPIDEDLHSQLRAANIPDVLFSKIEQAMELYRYMRSRENGTDKQLGDSTEPSLGDIRKMLTIYQERSLELFYMVESGFVIPLQASLWYCDRCPRNGENPKVIDEYTNNALELSANQLGLKYFEVTGRLHDDLKALQSIIDGAIQHVNEQRQQRTPRSQLALAATIANLLKSSVIPPTITKTGPFVAALECLLAAEGDRQDCEVLARIVLGQNRKKK